MKRLSLALALLLVFATPQAMSSPYIGLDAMFWDLEVDDVNESEEFDARGFRGRLGVMLGPIFGIEGHYGTGGSDSVTVEGPGGVGSATFDVELDRLTSVFARLQLPIVPGFVNLYGLGGYTEARATARLPDNGGISTTETGSGVSYGAGAELRLGSNSFLSADYIRYLDESDYKLSAVSAGLRFRF